MCVFECAYVLFRYRNEFSLKDNLTRKCTRAIHTQFSILT